MAKEAEKDGRGAGKEKKGREVFPQLRLYPPVALVPTFVFLRDLLVQLLNKVFKLQ